jgi:hypothetical protein
MNEEIKKIFDKKTDEKCIFQKNDSVILYGAGQMGADASVCLLDEGVDIKNFTDKNPNIINQKINGILVKHPEEISKEEKENCIFAISVITVPYNIIAGYLKELGCKKICFVGDLLNQVSKDSLVSKTWKFSDPADSELEKLTDTFEKLSDENSKKSLIQFLTWVVKSEEKSNFADVYKMNDKYFIPEVISALGKNETIVSYDFLSHGPAEEADNFLGGFKKIYIFEPTEKKFKEFKENINSDKVSIKKVGLANENSEKYFLNGKGLCVKARFVDVETSTKFPVNKLDDEMMNMPYSFLKIYGLGLAQDILKGAINSIKKYRPVLAVTIHHTREDFVEIPRYLMDNLKEYNFYLRLHSYCGFETLFYAIPKNKLEK